MNSNTATLQSNIATATLQSNIVKEFIFDTKKEMTQKMECEACKYEGFIPGRHGYNFPNKDGSYTISYLRGDMLTKMHELRHAKFYFDPVYRKEVLVLWNSFDPNEQAIIENFLNKCGYPSNVHLDELQAFWFTEKDPRKFFGLKKVRT